MAFLSVIKIEITDFLKTRGHFFLIPFEARHIYCYIHSVTLLTYLNWIKLRFLQTARINFEYIFVQINTFLPHRHIRSSSVNFCSGILSQLDRSNQESNHQPNNLSPTPSTTFSTLTNITNKLYPYNCVLPFVSSKLSILA